MNDQPLRPAADIGAVEDQFFTSRNFLLFDGNVGYLALTEGFGYTTLAEFNSAFLSLKQKGMTSLVLDLRGNGGGLMDQAIRIAERFLPAGAYKGERVRRVSRHQGRKRL